MNHALEWPGQFLHGDLLLCYRILCRAKREQIECNFLPPCLAFRISPYGPERANSKRAKLLVGLSYLPLYRAKLYSVEVGLGRHNLGPAGVLLLEPHLEIAHAHFTCRCFRMRMNL